MSKSKIVELWECPLCGCQQCDCSAKDYHAAVIRLKAEIKGHATFARFVIDSIKKTQNTGYVFTNSAENILRGAKAALEGEVK